MSCWFCNTLEILKSQAQDSSSLWSWRAYYGLLFGILLRWTQSHCTFLLSCILIHNEAHVSLAFLHLLAKMSEADLFLSFASRMEEARCFSCWWKVGVCVRLGSEQVSDRQGQVSWFGEEFILWCPFAQKRSFSAEICEELLPASCPFSYYSVQVSHKNSHVRSYWPKQTGQNTGDGAIMYLLSQVQ